MFAFLCLARQTHLPFPVKRSSLIAFWLERSSEKGSKVETPAHSSGTVSQAGTSSIKKKVKEEEPVAPTLFVWEKKGGWAVVSRDILEKLLKNKRVWPFEEPVDTKALKLGDYKKIVKKPMDLGTIKAKLEEGKYKELETSGEEFYSDVVLTFDNAMLYNNEGDEIWEHAAALKATFEEMWARMLEPVKGGQGGGTPGAPHDGDKTPASACKTPASACKSSGKLAAVAPSSSPAWETWAGGVLQKMMKAGYSKVSTRRIEHR